jgi:hypothetical protein
MSLIKKVSIISFFIILGVIITFCLNFFFIENLVIPKPCYYHNNPTIEMSNLFSLFYKITPSEGYHPFPSTLNFTLTLLIGILAGLFFGLKLTKSKTQ